MSDNIDVSITAGGEDGVNRIVSAIDRLYSGLEKLGSVSGLSTLEQKMAQMQASMTSGFAELAALAKKGGAEVVSATVKSADEVAKINEKARDRQLNADRVFAQAKQAMLDKQLQADVTFATAQAKVAQKAQDDIANLRVKSASKVDARTLLGLPSESEVRAAGLAIATQMREAVQAATAAEKAWAKGGSKISPRELLGLPSEAEMSAFATQLKIQMRAAMETDTLRSKSAPKVDPRTLLGLPSEASMSSFSNQLKAQMTNTAQAAAAADKLAAAHAKITPNVQQSTQAIIDHSHAMNEAHSLARGLAGSLGGLWLTYGSVVPLLAGAAIAGSLKNIVTVGKEVEYQLNFVAALTKQDVSLDKFLMITDSSLRSVVESSNAMRMLAQNGLNAQQSLGALPAILDLATVGEMEVGQAALAATGATSAFGLQITEVGRVADIFALTAAKSNTSVLAITESMKQASTVSSLFKVSIEETAAMLGLLAKINITGGAAGTSMTNMLTGLYEPTEKGKRALKELGVETMTTTGQLKPFTQLLEEMKGSLSRFNDSARVDLLGSIFTVRGVKAAELALQNIDTFKQKAEEARDASGFMRGVVTQLEDSTTGAFQRMGVTVQNTLVKSFAEAQPYIQRIGIDLTHAFASPEAQSGLANLSTNVAQLTSGLINNASGLATLVAGWVAWRLVAASLVPVISAAITATTASTTASAAATAASVTFNTAQTAGVATTGMYTAALEAQAVATIAATEASAAWGAVVLPALGALAIALAAGAALWLLFRDNTSEADRANLKIRNSIDVVNEGLDREIERLEKANDLWDKKNGRFKKDDGPGASKLEKARAQQKTIEEQIVASGGTVEGALRPQYITTPTGISAKTADYNEFSKALREARQNVASLEVAENEYTSRIKPKDNVSELRKLMDQAKEDATQFAAQATQKNSKGEFYQKDAAIRAIQAKGNDLVNDLSTMNGALASDGLTDAQTQEIKGRIEQTRTDLKELRDQASALQANRALKPNKAEATKAAAAARDEGNAEVKRLQGLLDLQRQSATANIAEAASRNRRGDLGDLELINVELKEKLATDQKALDVARAQANVPGTGAAKDQGFKNKELMAGQQKNIDVKAAAEKKQTVLAAMAEEERAYDAQTMRDRGQHVEAYLSDYEAKNRKTLDILAKDIAAADDSATLERLLNYEAFLERMKKAGTNAALGKELEDQFSQALTSLDVQLQAIGDRNGPGTGLSSMFTNAMDAANAYAATLPKLAKAQQDAQALANANPADKGLQKNADDLLIKQRTEAAAMRNIWIGVGDTIANSLSKAFGKSGVALGGLLKASIAYGVKRKQIDDDYTNANKGTAAERAVAEVKAYNATTGAQITMYADVAGAAQGFFSEGSKGYLALGAAQKAFRVIELAMAVQNAAVQSGLWGMLTGLFVTGETTKAAAAATGATVIGGANMAIGTTAAAAGVATQAIGDPYTAWARMAAMGVAMAALGFVVSGAGRGGAGGKTAAEVQKTQGSGGVFGDSAAKSNSIKNSLDMLEKNSDNLIPINRGMLDALRNIEESMGGLANLVARNPDVASGANFNVQEGTIKGGPGAAGALLGGAAGFAAGSAVSLVGAVLGPIGLVVGALVGKLLGSVWGKTTQKVVDSGIQFGGSVRGLQQGQGFNQYASVDTTKSSWFGLSKSTSNSVQTQGLGGELPAQLGKLFTDLETGLTAAAVAMGRPGSEVKSALDNLTLQMSTLSLKDLKGDELTAAISAVVSKSMDEMSEAAFPALDAFRQVGEGYTETVMRLANNYGRLDAAMASIGGSFGAVGMGSLAARERLIKMSGGMDALAEQTKDFADNFLSEAEKLAPVQKYVTEELGRLGYAGLQTREDFKAAVMGLVNSGALATEAGAKTYTGLMALEKAFAATTPEIKATSKSLSEITSEAKDLQDQLDELTLTRVQLIAKERAQLDPANRALFDQLQAMKLVAQAKSDLSDAYEKERTGIEDTIDRIGGLAKSWKKFRDGLLLGDKSPLTPMQKYQEAKYQFQSTVGKARAGDKDAQDRFEEVANAFLEASRVSNSSSDVYTADFAEVMGVTDEAIVWAEQQVDVAKESLKVLNQQMTGLIEIKAATLSVVDAIKALNLAQANTPESKITDLYRTLLKREPDSPGLKYWEDLLAKGVSLDTIAESIKGSAEYTGKPEPIYASAANNQQANAATSAAAEPGPTAAQMDALLAQMEALRKEQAQQTGATIDAAFASTDNAAEKMTDAVEESVAAAKWSRENKMDIV